MKQNWYQITTGESLKSLSSQLQGLSKNEAASRLAKYGLNQLPAPKTDTLWQIFWRQFNSPLIYVLLGAAVVIFFVNELTDALIILFVLTFNAIIGTIQEGRAQNTMESLRKLAETNAVVIREGEESIIPDKELVAGDIVVLQEGDRIPADIRIIQSHNLTVDEAVLTGESTPVIKIIDKLRPNLQIAEQINMVFKGTSIVAGNGLGLVVATGINTIIGGISQSISLIDTEDPMRKDIRQLSQLIIKAALIVCSIIFVYGIISGRDLREMFVTVVSLTVSVIPEGLPIVMTLVLATGVWRMSKQNALVKKLSAVEALGQAQVIAVDKTGTITKNELTVTKIYAAGKFFQVTGLGFESNGEVLDNLGPIDLSTYPAVSSLAHAAMFCANARVSFSEKSKQWTVSGDPTEAAMIIFAEKLGLKKPELEERMPRTEEIPFSFEKKYHVVVNRNRDSELVSVTGAPETVLEICKWIIVDGKKQELSLQMRKDMEEIYTSMQSEGLRILAVSKADKDGKKIELLGMEFVGFLGLVDTLRPEIQDSVAKARSAGMKIVMITGDHKVTAQALAKTAGIYKSGDLVMTGQEIDAMKQEEFSEKLKQVSVFARVTPDHKLKIIQAYRSLGLTIAMTGDGVNDAPSLVAADLGIAMGKIGTEVAKEASDIVLLDDNFQSIVAAIEEGRSIFKTIKKVILYLFSTGVGEIFTISGALFTGMPLPLAASQIIWLNFVTDGFLVIPQALEPKEEGLLHAKFTKRERKFLDSRLLGRMFLMSVTMATGTLIVFYNFLDMGIDKALTMSLTTMAVYQWFNAWNCRSDIKSIFSFSIFSNPFLLAGTFIVIGLQSLAIYHPFLQNILHTVPLAVHEWLVVVPVAFSIVVVEESRKFVMRRFAKLSGSI